LPDRSRRSHRAWHAPAFGRRTRPATPDRTEPPVGERHRWGRSGPDGPRHFADATAGRVNGPAGGHGVGYDSIFLLATMPLVRIAAVIGMCSAALLSLV